MCRAVAVWRLQLVTDVAVRRERQTLLRDRRPTDVPAEPFELLALIRSRRHASVQGKSSNLSDPLIEGLVTGRQRLQREHLAALLPTDGDAVGDRRTQELFHRPGLEVVTSQIAVLRIPQRMPCALRPRLTSWQMAPPVG